MHSINKCYEEKAIMVAGNRLGAVYLSCRRGRSERNTAVLATISVHSPSPLSHTSPTPCYRLVLQEAGRLAELHQQIASCDGILQSMEHMLSAFQSDLGNISGEIQSLQEQSLSMSVKLANRKAVQAPLSTFVGNLALSSELIDAILDLDVGDEFEVRLRSFWSWWERRAKRLG